LGGLDAGLRGRGQYLGYSLFAGKPEPARGGFARDLVGPQRDKKGATAIRSFAGRGNLNEAGKRKRKIVSLDRYSKPGGDNPEGCSRQSLYLCHHLVDCSLPLYVLGFRAKMDGVIVPIGGANPGEIKPVSAGGISGICRC